MDGLDATKLKQSNITTIFLIYNLESLACMKHQQQNDHSSKVRIDQSCWHKSMLLLDKRRRDTLALVAQNALVSRGETFDSERGTDELCVATTIELVVVGKC